MGLFVPLDVDFQLDPKIIAAGTNGECLFVRSLAVAKRTLSDGFIASAQLPSIALGLPGSAAKHAARLVEVGLWAEVEGGWQIVSWLKRNSSSAEIASNTEVKKAAAVKANHVKWHIGPGGKPKPGCPHCADDIRTGSESDRPANPTAGKAESTEVETESEQSQSRGRDRAESETSSSSSSCESGTPPLHVVDDDDVGFLRDTIERVADLRQMRECPRTPIPWRKTTVANLWIEEAAAILEAHHRRPGVDAKALAAFYEASPELHTGRRAS